MINFPAISLCWRLFAIRIPRDCLTAYTGMLRFMAMNYANLDYIQAYLGKISTVLKSLDATEISAVGALLAAARHEGRQVFVLGNGGSAALASHVAVDLGKGCSRNREKRFRVL